MGTAAMQSFLGAKTNYAALQGIASCCNEVLVDDSTFRAISKFILDEAVKQNVISLVPSSVNYKIYGLNKERVS